MLRLSKLTDYAVVVLIRLSEQDRGGRTGGRCCAEDGVQTSPGIAAATGVPEPTVAKVLKALTCSELVVSQRGARGGYRLARPLETITVADVITAIDGPIALTACVDGSPGGCDVQGLCAVKGRWDVVNAAIRDALGSINLIDLRAASVPPAFRVPEPEIGPEMEPEPAADRASAPAAAE